MPIWNAKHRQNPLLFAQRVNSNDIVLIVQKNQKKYKKVLAKMRTLCYTVFRQRECWNWQTGKTKDLVGVCSCGFKSHLPHISKRAESFEFVQVFCSFLLSERYDKCNVLIFILFIRNTFHLNICSQCGILHLYNRIESRM